MMSKAPRTPREDMPEKLGKTARKGREAIAISRFVIIIRIR
jgi:hypothetical protein